MAEAFFLRALAAGVGVALVAGPLGCFVVWRRMAYFGDTLAHAALLGVALGLLLEVNTVVAVFVVASAIAAALTALQRSQKLPTDALLGLLSHGALAVGLVVIGLMATVRFDLTGLLFGDILAVSVTDIAVIWVGGAGVLAVLWAIHRPLFAGTVSHEIAHAEGLDPDRARLVFTLLLAAVVAMAMKIVGVLLITAMLIVPAAAVRNVAATPGAMIVLSSIAGAIAVVTGLFGSLAWDTPSGPTIVVAALVLFVIGLTPAASRVAEGLKRRKIS